MKAKQKTKWPKWVPIPDEIGTSNYHNEDGTPCCAIGHAADVLGVLALHFQGLIKTWRRNLKHIAACAKIHGVKRGRQLSADFTAVIDGYAMVSVDDDGNF